MSDRYPGTLIHSSLLFIFSKEKEISPSPYCLLMLHTHATRPNHFVKPTIMHHTSRIELIPLDRLEFLVQVSDFIDNEWKTQSHRVGLDTHAYRRSRERRIGYEEIAAAMFFGYSEWKQGVCFYALTRQMVPAMHGIEYRRSEGLVVICDECSAQVRTCFRRKDPVNYVRKKPKYARARNNRFRVLQRLEAYHRGVYELEPHGLSGERMMVG